MNKNNTWMAQQLRVSIFPQLEGYGSTKDLWPKIQGVERETQSIDSKTGTSTHKGSYKEFKVILTANPVKVDLVLSVPVLAHFENNKPVIDILGSFSDSLKDFQPIVEAWINGENFPEVIRLAFGAYLVKEMTSKEESYVHLSKYIPFDLEPKTMSDFNLQLNLLAKSKQVKNLELNRISKWNLVKITPELAMIGNQKVFHEYPTINMSHLELDINTSQENKKNIDKKVILALYAELVALGGEISEKGIVNNAN